MSGSVLIVVGVILLVTGFAVAGGGQRSNVRVGNKGFSIFGSVRQSFLSIGMAINGERQKSARDWIGWTLSIFGIVIGVVGLVMS